MAFNIDEERLKPLFEYTSDGVIILDASMNIVALNPSAEEMTGWTREAIIGKKFPMDQLIYLESDRHKAPGGGLVNLKEPNFNIQIEIALPQGNKVMLPAIGFPMADGKGNTLYGLILENMLLKYGVGEKLIKNDRLDQVTALYHKAYFEEMTREEIKRMKKYGGSLGAILVQFENLPFIIESYGLSKGNESLRHVGEIVKGNARNVDLIGRTGEIEIMVLLINLDPLKLTAVLNRLKEKFIHANQGHLFPVPVKINIGKILLNSDYEEIFKRVKLSLEKFI